MSKKDFNYLSQDGVTQIHAIRWEPEDEPKAVVQIIHGMTEFLDRYDKFARFLTENGFLVVGEDHLGHGESVRSNIYHGYFGEKGNEWVIGDIHTLRKMIQKEFPEKSYLMLGHSMGSFLLRQYITENDAEYAKGLSGVVIMGTGWQPDFVIRAGMTVAKILGINKVGKEAPILDKMAFGDYLKRISNPKTEKDWLTRDDAIVEWYMNQPWCMFKFSPNAYYHMFAGMLKAHDIERMKKLPQGLPMLFSAGAEDPVGAWGEGVRKAYMVYTENTECNTEIKLYIDDRHEILNEFDKEEVYKDHLEFFNSCIS